MQNTFRVPFEKCKIIFFASSITKNIVVFAIEFQVRFPVKLIYCIAFEAVSSACSFLKSVSIKLSFSLTWE